MSQEILSNMGRILLITVIFAVGCETNKNDYDQNFKDDLELWSNTKDMPIKEIVAQTFVLQDLEALMVATRFAGEMNSPPYTVFTPWDIANRRLPYWKKMTGDRAWYGHLRDQLLGHIHQGNIPHGELRDGMMVTMLNGDVATITLEGSRVRVDGILVIAKTSASDGYLYMLDGVRPPRWTTRTVLDVINSDARFSTLAEILNHPSMSAKRAELGSTTAELTFFAPTNEALAGFNMERCQEPQCLAMLGQLVENHVVAAVVPRMFTPTQNFATQSGSSLSWNYATQNVTCTRTGETQEGFALGEFEEEYASNGIVQPIDELLCTEMDTCGSTDTDGDGAADCNDGCPGDPNKTEPGECGCGTPDVDGNGNGTVDCNEECKEACAPEQQCGSIDDGCGGTIKCGICESGQVCENHRCVDDNPGYHCDIVCGDGQILADSCQSPMMTTDEEQCGRKRDVCCVDDGTRCPTLCDDGLIFDGEAYLYWDDMTCREYMNSVTPNDPRCVNPLPHVPENCCVGLPPSPPAAPNPCYDLCGDDLQMVGSRVLGDYAMTCFDYARSTSAGDAACTAPDPAIVDRCCDSPTPLPKPVGNYCCLCDGCYGSLAERYYHKIGPEGLTCIGLDFHMTDHKYGDAECSAKQEAFSATCCNANFDPPPSIPSEYEGQPNRCNVPDPPPYCSDTFPRCDLCLDGSFPKEPYNAWTIAGISGNPTCGDLYWMGLYGGLPPMYCYPIQNKAQEACGCQ